MEYRRARPGDFQQILELQNKNLFCNLSPAERSDGFLSTAFTIEQFQAMDRGVGITVAADQDKVCGYF